MAATRRRWCWPISARLHGRAILRDVGRLDGKVALVTGAAGGIGRVAAELFAAEGARVMVADVVDANLGGEIGYVRADVSKAGDAERMVRATVEAFGGLHVLYNNAGVLPPDDGGTLD